MFVPTVLAFPGHSAENLEEVRLSEEFPGIQDEAQIPTVTRVASENLVARYLEPRAVMA